MIMCFQCNSYSCHHTMQSQQNMYGNQLEQYLRNQMGIAQMQDPRPFYIQEAVISKNENKKRKLLLLLR